MTILTEKKSVAENYIKALNLTKKENAWYVSSDGKINLTYAAGHLYTLFDAEDYNAENKNWYHRKLPIKPEEYLYKPIVTKKTTRTECEKVLKNAVKNGEEIVIATDPDREGEVIARLILRACKADFSKVTRIWCCEGLDRTQIISGIRSRKIDKTYDYLALQGEYQKKADWMFGINLTTAYTLLNNDGETYSIGRVQTAVLTEIYNRHKSILLFMPKRYYLLKLTMESGTDSFLINTKTQNTHFDDKTELERIKAELEKDNEVIISSVEREQKKELPPKLYDLAQLQIDAYKNYDIDVDQCLEIAQTLYNEKGKISYPRTDSVVLNDSDAEKTHELYEKIKDTYNFEFTDPSKINAANKRLFDSKGVTGHHGIIPSNTYEKEDSLDWKVYDLVARRFLMSGMGEYVKDEYKVYYSKKNHSYVFKSEGYQTVRLGWKEAELGFEDKSVPLNKNVGETDRIKSIEIVEKLTEPPKYYTQATLIKFMRNPNNSDEEGIKLSSIGTEATQASIIKTLFVRKYIHNVGKHIEILPKGIKIIEQIMDNSVLMNNTNVETTTRWEKLNKENPSLFLENVEKLTEKSISNMRGNMETVIAQREIGICPACGGKIMKGKNGFYCSGYKEKGCENNINYHVMGHDIDENFMKAFLESKKTDVMNGVKKDGSQVQFYFRIDENGKFTIVFVGNNEKICECPKCGKGIFEKKMVYKCENADCGFFMWKQTSGIKFGPDMIKTLCEGGEIKTEQTKKDKSTAKVTVRLDETREKIEISY